VAARRRPWTIRAAAIGLFLATAAGTPAAARGADDPGGATEPAGETSGEASGWVFGPSVLLYVLANEPNYLQPTLTADRGALHLEARYNYEDRETGSVYVGWNLTFGRSLRFVVTPMLGVAFGRTNGIVPALTLSIDWSVLSFWSQGEYVLDFEGLASSFFYSWNEVGVSNGDWLRVGVVFQRTRVFHTSTEVQVGPFVSVTVWKITAAAYLFAPAQADQFVVVSLAGAF